MKSIWNNTFYNTQPALGWTFEISFDEYYEGDNNENQLGLNRFAQAAAQEKSEKNSPKENRQRKIRVL